MQLVSGCELLHNNDVSWDSNCSSCLLQVSTQNAKKKGHALFPLASQAINLFFESCFQCRALQFFDTACPATTVLSPTLRKLSSSREKHKQNWRNVAGDWDAFTCRGG